ncbi:hypothetical protein ACFY64_31750 [Streptomyces collinus]|uniref:hypothetical protein n=1 Tax=Streptomyces collinus TaxID=42684 RepID=UPI00369AB872
MDATTSSAIFSAAVTAPGWKKLNTGLTVAVAHDGYQYTVQLPSGEKVEIVGREGFGGTEFLGVQGTWAQTVALTEAAMGATRLL